MMTMQAGNVEPVGMQRPLALLAKASEGWERWSARGSVAAELAITNGVRAARMLAGRNAPDTGAGPRASDRGAGIPGALFVVPWLRVGGADKAVVDIVRRLHGSAVDATVLATLGMRNPWAGGLRDIGVPVIEPQDLPFGSRARGAFIDRLVKERPIRLVQVAQSRAGYGMLERLRDAGTPKTVSLVQLPDPRALERDFVALSALHAGLIDRHVAVAPHVAEALASRGVPPARIVCIPNGVDTELFRPRHPGSDSDSGGFLAGLPEGLPVVAFVGRLVEQKDPLTFAHMVSRLRRRLGPSFCAIVVGGGPLRRLTEIMLRASGRPWLARVTGPASEPEVAATLRRATVLVAPSRYEGLPLVGLEAMASGVPIVASDVEGWRDVVQEGETGLLCAPGDPDAFAARTAELLADAALCARLGANARRIAEGRYALDLVEKQYRELYAALLS